MIYVVFPSKGLNINIKHILLLSPIKYKYIYSNYEFKEQLYVVRYK